MNNNTTLRHSVTKSIEEYFNTLDGQHAEGLYNLVISEVELGLFTTILKIAAGNQSLAAKWLGLARGTLRQRLAKYNL